MGICHMGFTPEEWAAYKKTDAKRAKAYLARKAKEEADAKLKQAQEAMAKAKRETEDSEQRERDRLEGEKQAAILSAEGQKQSAIVSAEGRREAFAEIFRRTFTEQQGSVFRKLVVLFRNDAVKKPAQLHANRSRRSAFRSWVGGFLAFPDFHAVKGIAKPVRHLRADRELAPSALNTF